MILREIKNIFIKNRLTEGVDFVRKEWLKTTGYAYINTKVKGNQNSEIDVIAIQRTNPTSKSITLYGSVPTPNGYSSISFNVSTTTQKNRLSKFGNRTLALSDYELNKEYTIFQSKDILSVNGIVVSNIQASNTFESGEIYLFSTNIGNDNSLYNNRELWIKGFMIRNVISLKPCQLLKSIPATLDANNIARSAGECGMYDSISGKFYGNVASSGSFTVEGEVEPETHTGLQQIYQNKLIEGVDYETADWLKMNIPESIIIDMMSLPINSNNVEFKRNWIQITNSEYFRTSNYTYYITDYGDANDLCPMVWKITPSQFQYIGNIKLGLGLHTIITNSNGVTISGNYKVASLSWYGNPITYMTFNNMMIFNKHTIHLTSSIKVDEVIRYVPCQLLKSIPRNLDAQCKERQAGECGMIDLISGKFYGNVASSGTFTVENDNNE